MAIDPRDDQDPLHRALRQLPPPQAPRTLAPRVMAAIAEAERRNTAPAQPGRNRPVEWQIAVAAVLALAAVNAVYLWPWIETVGAAIAGRGIDAVEARLVALAPGAAALARFVLILWDAFVQPVIGVVLVWIVMMAAACAALGAALERVAFGEASH